MRNEITRYQITSTAVIFLSLFLFSGCGSGGSNTPTLNINSGNVMMLNQNSNYDKQICNTGIEKAKQLGLNPVCVFADENSKLALAPGSMVSIKNNNFYFDTGDMVINSGDSPVFVQGVNLNPGEMAAWKNNSFVKMTQ